MPARSLSFVVAVALFAIVPAINSSARSDGDSVGQMGVADPRSLVGERPAHLASTAALLDGDARAEPCYLDDLFDTLYDVSYLDIDEYGLVSDCQVWLFAAITRDSWSAWDLDFHIAWLDIDSSSSTGCVGGDYVAVLTYDGSWRGGLFRTYGCDENDWIDVGPVYYSRPNSYSIAVGIEPKQVGGDTRFRWQVGLNSIYAYATDFAPDDSWRSADLSTSSTSPPTAPRELAAIPEDGAVVLDWRPPADDGGSQIVDYVVQLRTGGGEWSMAHDGVTDSSHARIDGLTNGRSYRFRVAAKNAAGRGAFSAEVTATPAGLPSAPRSVVIQAVDRGVQARWAAPATDGGSPVVDYVVQLTSGEGWETVADGVSTRPQIQIGELSNRKAYGVRVAARTLRGRGPWSAMSGLQTPSPPRWLQGDLDARRLTITWTAPKDNGGGWVSDYRLRQSTDGGEHWIRLDDGISGETRTVVRDLRRGTVHLFSVAAVNAEGPGAWSSALRIRVG